MEVKEKFRIVKVGRERAREGRGHTNYAFIYEAYVEVTTTRRVKVSGMLWWSKYTLKTETRWKYIGYHLSENSVMTQIINPRSEARMNGEVISEFSM